MKKIMYKTVMHLNNAYTKVRYYAFGYDKYATRETRIHKALVNIAYKLATQL